jgi:hypothetical protein
MIGGSRSMTVASARHRLLTALAGVLASIGLAACSVPHQSPHKSPEPWRSGFWVWAGDAPATATFQPEILYVEASGDRWPQNLPAAREYRVVQRIEPSVHLSSNAAIAIAERYQTLTADAGPDVRIAGIQIDYDCPTEHLAAYGEFLKELHAALPPGASLSITALLDWFGPHTSISRVLERVDEFVPQFYDTARERAASGIAEPIDSSRWSPVFNAYRVPYRIGISSFGRIARTRTDEGGRSSVQYFRDAGPADFSGTRGLARSAEHTTSAGELVIRYAVVETVTTKPELQVGDVVQVTFPTEASVTAAYESARRLGGYCAGVLFFRWPGRAETLALPPDTVHRIVTGASSAIARADLAVRPAACVERTCADLYLTFEGPASSSDRTIRIRANRPVDAFLPDGRHRSSIIVESDEIHFRVPAYSGIGTFYVGRAISTTPVQFEMVQP